MKNQSIRVKLTISAGVMLALTAALSYTSLSAIAKIRAELQETADVTARKAFLAGEMRANLEQLRVHQRGVVMQSMLGQPEQAQVESQKFRAVSENLLRVTKEIDPMLHLPEARQRLSGIRDRLSRWMPLYEEVVRLCAAKQFDKKLTSTIDLVVPAAEDMAKDADALTEIQRNLFADSSRRAEDLANLSRWIVAGVVVLSLLAGFASLWLVRGVSKSLNGITVKLAAATAQINSGSEQVSTASQTLAQNSSEQASSIEETSASTEEISSMTRRGADNAQAASTCMREAAAAITDANGTLQQMLESMRQIGASSDKIQKIIKVIDEIAFQTNILALNAAVEAARAGEAGMGFAVVAEEVRNLSQRSAEAAKDTAALIEESIATSADGTKKLDQVAKAIERITTSANRAKELVEEVKVGSEEQARGTEQIASAIRQMEQLTQRNAASAEESASAGLEMERQASELHQLTTELSVLVGSGDGRG